VIVESASLPGAKKFFTTLDELPERASEVTGGPALVVIGEVLREAIAAMHQTAAASSSETLPTSAVG